jgi:predicted ATPase
MLREIHISNFKSLKNVSVPLKRLSFFCGPNASGKSNLADALDFLSHVFRNGIQHAVAQKGGFYNICFRRIRRAKGPIRFRILGERTYRGQLFEFEINFSFRARTEAIRSDFLIEAESYVLRMKGDGATRQTGWIEISRQDRTYIARQSDGAEGLFESGMSRVFGSLPALNKILAGIYRPRPQQLLLGPLIEGVGFNYFRLFKRVLLELEGLRVFQISPRTARQAGVPSVTKGMGLHGENLAVAVASFLENKRLAPRLLAWMQDVVPELSNLQTGYTETKQIGLFLQERGFGSPWYAEDLSDGTIMALA